MPTAGKVTLTEGDAPATPDAGTVILYANNDVVKIKDDTGTETDLTAGGGSGDLSADTLTLNDGSELTIATGAITATAARHTVDTESDGASDDLDTVNGLSANEVCFITANHTDRTVVVKHGTGNISTPDGNDITLDDAIKAALLIGNTAGTGVNAYPVNGGGGGGGIGGSTGATDNAILRANGTGGSTLQNSAATIDGNGRLTTAFVSLPNVTELTISSGAITPTQMYHSVDTEADAASDDLTTIAAGTAGDRLYLFANNGERTVTLKHGTGNISLFYGDDIDLDEAYKMLEFVCDGTSWYQVGGAGIVPLDHGGTGGTTATAARANLGAQKAGEVNVGLVATRTISSGVLSTGGSFSIKAAAESGTTDDLIEITGMTIGDIILLAADSGDTITVKHNDAGATIKIYLSGEADLDLTERNPIMLQLRNTNELVQTYDASGGGGGSGHATAAYEADEGSNYTTTSTSFVDVDGTNFAHTITVPASGKVLVGFAGGISATARVKLNVSAAGSDVAGDDGIFTVQASNVNGSFAYLCTGLTAGSREFKLRWKVNSGTGTIYAGAGLGDFDNHPQFWVIGIE
ncbi:MAG: hypothetical protein ACPG7F_00500 [Aggregatilineales bacterium]